MTTTDSTIDAAQLKADIAKYRQRLIDGLPLTVKVKGHKEPLTIAAHPETAKLPVMDEDAFAVLVHDIDEHGMRTAVTLVPSARSKTKAQVLLGRHRVAAAAILGREIEAETFAGDALQAKAEVVSSDLYRRHMTDAQQAVYVVQELLPAIEAAAAERQRLGTSAPDGTKGARSSEVASSLINGAVSSRSIDRAKKVVEAPETLAKVQSGEIRQVAKAETAAKTELGDKPAPTATRSVKLKQVKPSEFNSSLLGYKTEAHRLNRAVSALTRVPTEAQIDSWTMNARIVRDQMNLLLETLPTVRQTMKDRA